MRLLAPLLLVPFVVLADNGLRQGGTYIGPIVDIDCAADGGLYCTRDAGVRIGKLRCVGATSAEPGCITPNAQTLGGDKSWTGFQRLVGVTHASLTACDSSHKNMMQGCTSHGALVWCDGTTNVELSGSAQGEQVLDALPMNGIPSGIIGASTIGSNWTVNAINGVWNVGSTSDAGTFPIAITDLTNYCVCYVPCDAPGARTSCSGTCTFSSGSTVYYTTVTPSSGGGGGGFYTAHFFGSSVVTKFSQCEADPAVVSGLTIMGYSR